MNSGIRACLEELPRSLFHIFQNSFSVGINHFPIPCAVTIGCTGPKMEITRPMSCRFFFVFPGTPQPKTGPPATNASRHKTTFAPDSLPQKCPCWSKGVRRSSSRPRPGASNQVLKPHQKGRLRQQMFISFCEGGVNSGSPKKCPYLPPQSCSPAACALGSAGR